MDAITSSLFAFIGATYLQVKMFDAVNLTVAKVYGHSNNETE